MSEAILAGQNQATISPDTPRCGDPSKEDHFRRSSVKNSSMYKIITVLVTVAIIAASLVTTGYSSAASDQVTPSKGSTGLSKHDRELVTEAIGNGESTVMLLIASRPGANRTVVTGLTRLGATIRYRDDDVSYIRALVPVSQADAASRLSGVQAIEVDAIIPLDDPRPDGVGPVIPQP